MAFQSCRLFLLLVLLAGGSCKKDQPASRQPYDASLEARLVKTNPFTYQFTASARDVEGDPLQYAWDFGEGTRKTGAATETFVFPEGRDFTVQVSITDGKTAPIDAQVVVSTRVVAVTVDAAKQYQTIEGFGGFGAQNVYWSNGPFTSPAFVNAVVNELGATVIREDLPTSFEIENDNADPFVTDLSKYNLDREIGGHHKSFGARLPHLRALRAAGVERFIATVWSPPPWMKTNNRIDNGTNQNSAPEYNPNPTAANNQLRTDMYEEFAELCVAYAKIFKREVGVDLYAFSIQNEPRFSQSYQSCVYNGSALRDVLKVVGRRFRSEGLPAKLFVPEDIGWLQAVEGMVKPSLDDPDARQYVDAVAVHGYDFDGIRPNSPSAQTWNTMYGWGNRYGKPLWMTETSGFKNDWSGAMSLATAIYTALRHGNVSAWVFWSLSTDKLDEYCLMNAAGEKSKRFYASAQFYRFVRPGAVRIEAVSADENVVLVAFRQPSDGTVTLVLLNVGASDKMVRLSGNNLPG
nr:PKD domain-containing protein [Cytophagales bacterium]